MVGNVNGIVESMYAAENARTQQSAASGKTGNFSGYLDAALLNYRTGLFTQGLGGGFGNALYMNALSGQTWQSIVLKARKTSWKRKNNPVMQRERIRRTEKRVKFLLQGSPTGRRSV